MPATVIVPLAQVGEALLGEMSSSVSVASTSRAFGPATLIGAERGRSG